MSSVYLSADIAAPQSLVWRILTRKERWYRWNTYLFDLDRGLSFAPGREVWLGFQRLPTEKTTAFRPVVTGFSPERFLCWDNRVPGLHTQTRFDLQALGPERTQYSYSYQGSGPLDRLVLPLLRQDERRGGQRMARELKAYAERVFRNRPPQDGQPEGPRDGR